MPITSSTIVSVGAQRDGRRWVLESHLDQLGIEYTRNYLAGALDDLNAALANYAAQLLDNIRDTEIGRNIDRITTDGSVADTSTVYSTAAQNFAALREVYRAATRTQAVMIADFLVTLTDIQLQTAFGMTQAQVTTLRTNKLTPAASLATSIRASAGQ